jgi:KDO transferase-3
MRHMRLIHPDLCLREAGNGAREVLWKTKLIGTTLPLTQLTQARESDCFIVGTGPSLADVDFARLKGRTCFGVNGSILKSTESGVPFTYHIIMDLRFFQNRFELVRQALLSGAECLLSFRGLSVVCERAPELLATAKVFLLDEVNAHYGQPKLTPDAFDRQAEADRDMVLHPHVRRSQGRVGFCLDIRKGVFTGQTIVYGALQVACWLGYRRIFILGMDLGGTGGNARFYEFGKLAAPMRLDRDFEPFILPAFEVARDVLGAAGVQVYNLSPHSLLPDSVIPKRSLVEVLAMERQSVSSRVSREEHPS